MKTARKPTSKKTPEGQKQNVEYCGEQLLDHVFGRATMALLQQGKPVTAETLRVFLQQDTEFNQRFYIPAYEFLDSLQNT